MTMKKLPIRKFRASSNKSLFVVSHDFLEVSTTEYYIKTMYLELKTSNLIGVPDSFFSSKFSLHTILLAVNTEREQRIATTIYFEYMGLIAKNCFYKCWNQNMTHQLLLILNL